MEADSSVVRLSADDTPGDVCRFRPDQFLARPGERPAALYRLIEGWAARYQLLADGRRQTTALFLPGDHCEPQWVRGRLPLQPIVALTALRAACLPCRMPEPGSALEESLWDALVASNERQASWLVTLGRMGAVERIAELLLDVFERMRRAGLAPASRCAMPLTQVDIADVAGLTPVHVNRTLQAMRAEGLIELKARQLYVPDPGALRDMARMGPRRFAEEAR